MKTIKKIAIIGFLILFCFTLEAQVSLPYFTGFENASQQAGWSEYQKAEVTFCHWYMASNIGHGFAPSSGITIVDNWMVSPPFSITNGGKLDSIRYKFSGFSQPESGDTIAIYLLNGSQDPSLASSKKLLFDFRGSEYIIDDTFRIKTNIVLPAQGGLSYLAIRYRNSDCSYKWLTVSFDNIAISGNNVGIDDLNTNVYKINIYPNPAKNNLTIECNTNIKQKIEIYNMVGQSVFTSNLNNNATIDISNFQKGVYYLKMNTKNDTITRKFVKE